jgi:hypothetical protein
MLKVSPLRRSGTLITSWAKLHRSSCTQKHLSPCVVPRITLWKLIGHWLIRLWNLKRIASKSKSIRRPMKPWVYQDKSRCFPLPGGPLSAVGRQIFRVWSERTQVNEINLRWIWDTRFRLIWVIRKVLTIRSVWLYWCWFVDCFFVSLSSLLL